MFNRTRTLALCLALVAPTGATFAQEADENTVVATVNGTEITVGHMIVLLSGLPQQYQDLSNDVLFEGILDQMIQQSILADTLETPSRAVDLKLENDRRALMAGEAMQTALDGVVTDDALQSAYDERFADAEPTMEFNASHILVETEEEALALIAALNDGADFAETARQNSTGPSGPNGGELGWFGRGTMVPPFEEAVVVLQVGTVSDPVQTQFGWHVIRLNESRTVQGPSLDDVRQELTDQIQQEFVDQKIQELTDAATVERADVSGIDPSILRQIELVRN